LIVAVGGDGHRLRRGGGKFDVGLFGPTEVQIHLEDRNDGTYTLSFTPHREGDYELQIKVGDVHIMDSPVSIQILDKLETRDPKSIINPIHKFGCEGTENGQFRHAQGLCVNSKGEIIVADHNNHRIQIFSKDGLFLRRFGAQGSDPGQFNQPEGVTTDKEDQIYVTEWSGHRVQIFNSGGHYISQFGKQGLGKGQFSSPAGIMIDPQNGHILVADFYNNRVQIFDSQGQYLTQFGNEILSNPIGICMNSRREIFVSEYRGHCVDVFDEGGRALHLLGNGQFLFPRYLCVDGNDNLYVCSGGNSKVFVYDRSGRFIHAFVNEKLTRPIGIAFNPVDGSLDLVGDNGHAIFIF